MVLFLISIPVVLGLLALLYGWLLGDIAISFGWIWWTAKWVGVPGAALWFLSSLLPSSPEPNYEQQPFLVEPVPTYTNEEILMPGVDVRCSDAREQINSYLATQEVKRQHTDALTSFFHGVEVHKSHNIFGGTDLTFVKPGRNPLEMSQEGETVVIKEIRRTWHTEVFRGTAQGAVQQTGNG